jgi:hypothetical protein
MCASTPEKVEILALPEGAKPGDRVLCQEFTNRPDAQLNPKKKVWETVAPDLSVDSAGVCVFRGHPLRVLGAGAGAMDGAALTVVFFVAILNIQIKILF